MHNIINNLTIKDEKFNLIFQVQKYLLSTFIVRSGGVLNDSIHVPFNKDIKGKTVVICGAGTFGQQLVKRIEEYNYCKIAAWVDDDYWEYRRCCLNVDPISSITDLKYDFVVIGMVDNLLAKKMKNRLIDCGISSSKVLMLSVNDEIIESYLNQYLYCKTRG